jgi:large conductance mechanosensitive channel
LFNADSLKNSLVVELPGDGELSFGLVLAAVIQFLLVAAVVYFVFVLPLNHLKHMQDRLRNAGLPPQPSGAPATELDLLTEIRDLLAARPDDATAQSGTPKHTR